MTEINTFIQTLVQNTDNYFVHEILTCANHLVVWIPSLLAAIIVIFRDRSVGEAILTSVSLLLSLAVCTVSAMPIIDIHTSSTCVALTSCAVYLSLVYRHAPTTVALSLAAILGTMSSVFALPMTAILVVVMTLISTIISFAVYMAMRYIRHYFMSGTHRYYSSAYTKSGYSCDDMYIVLLVLTLTFLYILV